MTRSLVDPPSLYGRYVHFYTLSREEVAQTSLSKKLYSEICQDKKEEAESLLKEKLGESVEIN